MPYFYLIIILLLLACKGEKKIEKNTGEKIVTPAPKAEGKYVNSIQIISPEKNTLLSYNDLIDLRFSVKEKFPVDSVQIFWEGKKIASLKDAISYSFRLPPGKTGKRTLKVIAFHPDNKKGVASVNIELKPDVAPQKYGYEIVKIYSHDPGAYTQGLVYQDNFMYESTGQYGESGIRKYDMKDGKILSVLNIDSKLFGEGITIYKDKIFQLTWTSGQGFIYDLKTFSLESTFRYNTQGWGITTLDDRLIMSDGSHKLYHIAPSTFGIIQETEVYDHNGPVKNLNELEYIDGLVWANVWMSDRIVMIDPESGEVKGEMDLADLLPVADQRQLDDSDDVLNGIAWNPEKKTVYLTGKRWPKLFELKIK